MRNLQTDWNQTFIITSTEKYSKWLDRNFLVMRLTSLSYDELETQTTKIVLKTYIEPSILQKYK